MFCVCWVTVSEAVPNKHGTMLGARRLPISLSAVRFRTLFGAGFSEKYRVSLRTILGHCFDGVSMGKALHSQIFQMSTW